jgi:hypothetical protein
MEVHRDRGLAMGQFFSSNLTDRSCGGSKPGPWRRDLPRSWRSALDLPEESTASEAFDGGDPAADSTDDPVPDPVAAGKAAGPALPLAPERLRRG